MRFWNKLKNLPLIRKLIEFFSPETRRIQRQFRQSLTDRRVRERLLADAKAKNPGLTETQCMKRVLESYFRDRGYSGRV